MGIPKFFRYISERYPMTSQLIQENQIPEFDNLYVDFNGIIHNCSHPNDNDAHFRLSEEQIFTAIFSYVDMLFGKIKPKKLFFMAVDGVAPRAKMNQQRSRRFRTAKEAKDVREKALSRGEKLPDEKAFDSNCITPGTPFMARLSNALKYFVNKKVTEDSNWRNIKVVLSGHEVPGEGEHKIMEYIRLSKAQPKYDPNTRHCLYGLDADLIMLGLLSHDPHFCLLREEVKFGPARKKSSGTLESINFYLLHISMMREYLDLEFHDVEAKLPFQYNLERIIDDFVLLAVFVGNDFLPHLPDLHIHENGLERLFEIYKKALPSLGGYMNESGTIDLKRLQVILNEMAAWEMEVFEKEYADLNWYKGKQSKFVDEMETARKRSKLVLTRPQQIIYREVKEFVVNHLRYPHLAKKASLKMPNTFSARERKFITDLAGDLNLVLSWDEYDEDQNLVVWRFPGAELAEEEDEDEEEAVDEEVWEDVDEEEDEESKEAIQRVLKKYESAKVADDDKDGDFDARHERRLQEKMDEWKRGYYMGKLEISYDDPQDMNAFIYCYVEGLQWVMHYYYSGVASWSWFYHYHYAPRISDLKGVDKMSFNFDLGRPFKPFEQLMGVLPEASKEHIPMAYRDLMYDVGSPILDFYPQEFEQDMNGKKQEWEAVVKIPFIEESRLLRAMKSREHRLDDEEKRRNSFGTSTLFSYNEGGFTQYLSPLPHFLPNLPNCTCKMEVFNLPILDGLHLVPGLRDGVRLGKHALAGFPTIDTIPHSAMLGYHGVNVHGSESKNKSMVIHVQDPEEEKSEAVAQRLIGTRVFIGWPFLREGKIVAISDSLFKYEKVAFGHGNEKRILSNPHSHEGIMAWNNKAQGIENFYSKRLGVITGTVKVLVHIRPLKGLKRLDTGALVKEYEQDRKEVEQALQMIVREVESEDPRYLEKEAPPLAEEFQTGTKLFFLGDPPYGVAAQVQSTQPDDTMTVVLAFCPNEKERITALKSLVDQRAKVPYLPSYLVAEKVGISGHVLSKITSSFMVMLTDSHKVNLGLSLKFEGKALKVIGYTRKEGRMWEYSHKAIDLVREYKDTFPELFFKIAKSGDHIAKSRDIFQGPNADQKVKEVAAWLKNKGVRDFEEVSLFCDQLEKQCIADIIQFIDKANPNKVADVKKVLVKSIPRQAVLKPAHAEYRLQTQQFELGDRVVMVQDSGGIPLAVKGVVVGLNPKSMDVVWDVPVIPGHTLGDRCPQYRGSAVEFTACLNLTRPQFVTSTNKNDPPAPPQHTTPFRPKFGPHPVIQPKPGYNSATGFRPAPPRGGPAMRIMTNPNRNLNPNGQSSHHNRGAITQPHTPQPIISNPVVSDSGYTSMPESNGGPRQPPHRGGYAGRGHQLRNDGPPRGRGHMGDRGYRGRGRGRGGPHGPVSTQNHAS